MCRVPALQPSSDIVLSYVLPTISVQLILILKISVYDLKVVSVSYFNINKTSTFRIRVDASPLDKSLLIALKIQ